MYDSKVGGQVRGEKLWLALRNICCYSPKLSRNDLLASCCLTCVCAHVCECCAKTPRCVQMFGGRLRELINSVRCVSADADAHMHASTPPTSLSSSPSRSEGVGFLFLCLLVDICVGDCLNWRVLFMSLFDLTCFNEPLSSSSECHIISVTWCVF